MTYYKILLGQLLISIAICNGNLQNTDSSISWDQIASWNRSTYLPSDIGTLRDKVQLKVYYETLCPASVDFFVTQLRPTVKRLGSHLEVHLIPYGHAKTFGTRGHYTFSCQHGSPECYANMVHACAIEVLQNVTHAILFNGCLMQYTSYQSDYDYFVSVLTWCGYTENVHIYEIWKCMHSARGPFLLKGYGDETHELQPSYVPYLMLDGSSEYQDQAAGNLLATVCQILKPKPSACFSTSQNIYS